jgi:hypothetical protein
MPIELTHPENCECWICEYYAVADEAWDSSALYSDTEVARFYQDSEQMYVWDEGSSKLLNGLCDDMELDDAIPF